MEKRATLREQFQQRHIGELGRSIRETYGVDIGDKAIDFENPFFSFRKFRERAYELASRSHLREASAETTFGALLRAGIDTVANRWYTAATPTYADWVQETTSSGHSNFYAPMSLTGYPRRVGPGENFPEVGAKNLDVRVQNYKFGAITSFERELFDDDQSGQISDRAMRMGENAALIEEVWAYAKFIGAPTAFNGETIPGSETKPPDETVWPWSVSLVGGGRNRPAAYGPLTMNAINEAVVMLRNQLDVNGNAMVVMPDTLLVSPSDLTNARVLLNSQYYPGVPSTTTGAIGVQFAANPWQGAFNIVSSRFMPAGAWAVGQSRRGFVFQRRDPMEIVQENPASGPAFSADVYRFRSRSRFNVDHIDPRFWFLGNDGSV